MPLKKIDKIILAYLAGAMDSDGYFTIKRQTYGVRVRKDSKNPTYYERAGIKQISPEIVDLVYKYFGGYRHIQKPNTPNGKPLHAIELRNLKCHAFVMAILPFLRIKRVQANILMELRKNINKGRDVITTSKVIKNGKTVEYFRKGHSDKNIGNYIFIQPNPL